MATPAAKVVKKVKPLVQDGKSLAEIAEALPQKLSDSEITLAWVSTLLERGDTLKGVKKQAEGSGLEVAVNTAIEDLQDHSKPKSGGSAPVTGRDNSAIKF